MHHGYWHSKSTSKKGNVVAEIFADLESIGGQVSRVINLGPLT